MKEIKNIFIGALFVCTILFILSLPILDMYKIMIFAFVLLFSALYCLVFLCLKVYADISFSIFIKIIINELPQEDIDSLIANNLLLYKYNHTLKSLFQTLDEVSSYAEKNFTEESVEKLIKSLENMTNIMENIETYVYGNSKKG